jgi:hypothetical protein
MQSRPLYRRNCDVPKKMLALVVGKTHERMVRTSEVRYYDTRLGVVVQLAAGTRGGRIVIVGLTRRSAVHESAILWSRQAVSRNQRRY